jgi:hypothetical protein
MVIKPAGPVLGAILCLRCHPEQVRLTSHSCIYSFVNREINLANIYRELYKALPRERMKTQAEFLSKPPSPCTLALW